MVLQAGLEPAYAALGKRCPSFGPLEHWVEWRESNPANTRFTAEPLTISVHSTKLVEVTGIEPAQAPVPETGGQPLPHTS